MVRTDSSGAVRRAYLPLDSVKANRVTSCDGKCRLLYLVGQLGAGGLERQLCYLLQTINRERYKPEVVIWSFCDDDAFLPHLRKLGIPLHLFSNGSSPIEKLLQFRRIVRRVRPEVIHSYSFYTNFAAWWASFGTKTIPIGSSRSNFLLDKKDSGPLLGRLSARWPRQQIFNSFAAAETAQRSRTFFVPRERSVVRNGLDLERFGGVPLSSRASLCIVGVGSLMPYKRWDRLLEAAQTLKRSGFDFQIRIAGNGPLRESLEHQAEMLNIADRVEFLGYIDDIAGLLAEADVLAHTSDIEGCPNAVMEAMACGRAVVAMDAGDIPLLVEDGKTGFVVRRGDVASLVDCIMHLAADRELCQSMGKAGRVKAEQEFDLKRLTQETLDVYRASGWNDRSL